MFCMTKSRGGGGIGVSLGGTIVRRGKKPKKEKFGPFCYQCDHYIEGICYGGDIPFAQTDMDVAQKCRKFYRKRTK